MTDENVQDVFDRAQTLTPQKVQSLTGADVVEKDTALESSVVIEFNIGTLPFGQSNAKAYFELMRDELKVSPAEELVSLVNRNQIDLSRLTLLELDKIIPLVITCRNGLLVYPAKGKEVNVPIPFVSVGPNAIKASANSTSENAERVLVKTFECLQRAAGINKTWTDADNIPVAKGFATSTIETLNFGLDATLSDKLNGVVKGLCSSPDFSKLGAVPLDQATGHDLEREYEVIAKFGELDIQLVRWDKISGDRYESTINVRPKTKVDVGKGQYVVVSEYDYDTHKKLVDLIRDQLE